MYFFDKLRVQKNTIKQHYSFQSYNNSFIIGINSPTTSMFFLLIDTWALPWTGKIYPFGLQWQEAYECLRALLYRIALDWFKHNWWTTLLLLEKNPTVKTFTSGTQ